jgi:hypothetical protein
VILSNIKYLTPPIKPWDGEFGNNVREMSDRLFFQEIGDGASLHNAAQPFASHRQGICYLYEISQPIAPDFLRKLEAESLGVVTTNLMVPEQPAPLYKQARAALWAVLKSHAPQYAPSTPNELSQTNAFAIKLFRIEPSTVQKFDARGRP